MAHREVPLILVLQGVILMQTNVGQEFVLLVQYRQMSIAAVPAQMADWVIRPIGANPLIVDLIAITTLILHFVSSIPADKELDRLVKQSAGVFADLDILVMLVEPVSENLTLNMAPWANASQTLDVLLPRLLLPPQCLDA